MSDYDPNCDYCGPGQTFWTRWVPRRPFGVDINLCCYAHDRAYKRGSTGIDRLEADLKFYWDIIEVMVAKWWIPSWLARWVAQRYYVAVRLFGAFAFNYKD